MSGSSGSYNPSQISQTGYQHSDAPSYSIQQYTGNSSSELPNLQSAVAALASSFPLAPALSQDSPSAISSPSSSGGAEPNNALQRWQRTITLDTLVHNFLPPYADVVHLLQSYLELAPWFFGAVTKRQIEGEIMPLWYEEASSPSAGGVLGASPTGAFPTTASPNVVAKRHRTSHDLALLFVLCCFGALNDVNLPAAPDNVPAEKFYQLTKAALSLDPGGANGVGECLC